MKNCMVAAFFVVTGALAACGPAEDSALPDGSEHRDVVAPESPDKGSSTRSESAAGCTSTQFVKVMDHCQDNHGSGFSCCHVTSCNLSASGYLVYTWDGYYAC